jgi:hypothetical protein
LIAGHREGLAMSTRLLQIALLASGLLLVIQLFPQAAARLIGMLDVRGWSPVHFAIACAALAAMLIAAHVLESAAAG